MLFNSYEFIFIFLPIILIVYFLFIKFNLHTLSKMALIIASIYFYGNKAWGNLIILFLSIFLNYFFYKGLLYSKGENNNKFKINKYNNTINNNKINKKLILILGILFNVLLLSYFKYSTFLLNGIIDLKNIAIPLGISFFTFQQIGFLVDTYRGEVPKYNIIEYINFVTFFPYIISGPIVKDKEIMEPMKESKAFSIQNFSLALYIFAVGLAKKVLIADYLAKKVALGFNTENLTFLQGWITSGSYTIQLFLDFSAYTEMAIALALMFNIKLPFNFLSPYRATSIRDFWNNWHITLGRFLTKYIYFPLGGNRKGKVRTYFNLFTIFIISGIWHGAGWMFILWGALHGCAMVIHRIWRDKGYKMKPIIGWFLTINFVNIAWVFFRADSLDKALNILGAMTKVNTIKQVQNLDVFGGEVFFIFFIGITVLVMLGDNVKARMEKFKPNFKYAFITGVLLVLSILSIKQGSDFIYFKF